MRRALDLAPAALQAVAEARAAVEAQGQVAVEVAPETSRLGAQAQAARVDGPFPIQVRKGTASSRSVRATRATRISAIAALPREEASNFP